MVGSTVAAAEVVLNRAAHEAYWFRVRARVMIMSLSLINMIFLAIASQNGLHTFLPPGQEVGVDYMQGALGPQWLWIILGGIGYGVAIPLLLALIMPTDTKAIRAVSVVFLFIAGQCPWMTCLPTMISNVLCEKAAVASNVTLASSVGGGAQVNFAEAEASICSVQVVTWALATLFCFGAFVFQIRAVRLTRRSGKWVFAMPARQAFTWTWSTARLINFAFFVLYCAVAVISSVMLGSYYWQTQESRLMLTHVIGAFLGSIPWTPYNRRFLMHLVFNSSTSAAQRKEAKAAASIAAMVGKLGRGRALHMAKETFRGLGISELHAADFDSNADARGLFARTSRAKLGEVDGFVSHSWQDPGPPKFAVLSAWAAQEKAQCVWLDVRMRAQASNPTPSTHPSGAAI